MSNTSLQFPSSSEQKKTFPSPILWHIYVSKSNNLYICMLPGVKKCKQATCDNVCSVGIKNNKVVTNEKLHEHMRMS